MKLEKIKLELLKDNPDNVRVHGDRQIKEFVRSIEQFGVIRPVVVDEDNMILVGHGLATALRSMQKEEVEVYRVLGLDENQKKKLMLADNKIYALGSDNFENIDKILSSATDFDIPGYSAEDLKTLYGDKTIVEQLNQYKLTEEQVKEKKERSSKEIQVPTAVQEARQDQEEKLQGERKYVLCPSCGEKIYLDD